jgi:hypothetical protein
MDNQTVIAYVVGKRGHILTNLIGTLLSGLVKQCCFVFSGREFFPFLIWLNNRTTIFTRQRRAYLVCRHTLLPVAFWTLSFQKMEYSNHGSKQRIQSLPPVVIEFNEESRNL